MVHLQAVMLRSTTRSTVRASFPVGTSAPRWPLRRTESQSTDTVTDLQS
jgi:hypothetical protein